MIHDECPRDHDGIIGEYDIKSSTGYKGGVNKHRIRDPASQGMK